ncbi:MAG: glycosyltransferase family 4 protein [Paenibacillaceae bacterium]
MRIAFICTEKLTVPPIRGGAIQILIDGVAPYIGGKHDLAIYCITDPDLPEREIHNGIEYIRIPREDYNFEVAKELSKRYHRKQSYELIHVFNRPRDILLYKSAMPDSRFIVSLHNEMFKESKISEEMGKLVIKAVDGIMSISNYIGHTIISRFPAARTKVRTIYSGINLNIYKPVWAEEAQSTRNELRRQYGVAQKKVILFVGRLSQVKGPHILIQAMEQVIQEHDDAILLIIGSKWFSDNGMDAYTLSLRRLAQSLGEDRVIFTNFIAPSEIPSHFLLGDIFVCSSQWQEPLARVHYEAMGAGLPIITTHRGGNAEVIRAGENGIVIDDYSNPQAWSAVISYLLSNPAEAMKLARAGRAIADKNFGFEHAAGRLENLYLSAMRRRR